MKVKCQCKSENLVLKLGPIHLNIIHAFNFKIKIGKCVQNLRFSKKKHVEVTIKCVFQGERFMWWKLQKI
jgi:hypothetical protein